MTSVGRVVGSIVLVGLLLLVGGCGPIGDWVANLFSSPTVVARLGEESGVVRLTISVRGMGSGGASALAVTDGALRFDGRKVLFTTVTGKGNFRVLYSKVSLSEGTVDLVVSSPLEGIRDGDVVEVRGYRLAPGDLGVALVRDGVSVLDSGNRGLASFSVILR